MSAKVQKSTEIKFKDYDQNKTINIPVLLKDLVKDNILVQIINEVIEGIEISKLEKYYTGKGCRAYHPKMLLKVWVYGFCSQVYTSRRLAKKLREDLCFMWLAAGHCPCFKTLSDFRCKRMQGMVDIVFKEVLFYLVEHEYIDLNDLYIDGSKWEANANKHKIIWRKNTERYKQRVLERIALLLEEAKGLQEKEDKLYGSKDLKEHKKDDEIAVVLTSVQLTEQIKHVNDLVEAQNDKAKKRSLEKINRHLKKEAVNLNKYEEQEKILDKRNSFSRTDEDATAMRMKNDELKPGYNTEISTSNQFIVNATIHENASDSPTLPSHVDKLEYRVEGLIADWHPSMTMDAGYGSEENYDYLESKGINAYVKYPLWYQEVSGELAKKKFRKENWLYNEEIDSFLCPAGKVLNFIEEKQVVTQNGYTRELRIYESEGCQGCPMFKECRGEHADPKSNRKIQISQKLETYKGKARAKLASDEGIKKRSQRGVDVETPFGDIKYNMKHRRFILRSKEKVYIEFLLLSISHNLRKVYCAKTGIWKEYYAQRTSKRKKRQKKMG